jgi:hypothetical protein
VSADAVVVLALIGFLVAGILVATVVAVVDNLFFYKRRHPAGDEPSGNEAPPDGAEKG